MSTRQNSGSHFENHQREDELRDGAAHAHRAGVEQGNADHLTGHEQSRQALEHSPHLNEHTQAAAGHGIRTFGHAEIAALAYELWEARGRPDGSSQEDWFRAAEELRSRAFNHIT
jgi:hypothetical protein